jgi:hypothetical protein
MFLIPYDCKGVTTGVNNARSFSRFRLQPPNRCNQIRPPYVCLKRVQPPNRCNRSATRYDRHTSPGATSIRLFGGATRLQPDTTAIRPPYVCLEARLWLQRSATYLQPDTTAIRLQRSCKQLRPPYVCLEVQPDCNQIRPPYDRHTSVWRSVCAATDLQPHAIRYDRHTTATRNGDRHTLYTL